MKVVLKWVSRTEVGWMGRVHGFTLVTKSYEWELRHIFSSKEHWI